jgi:hypothetical protein
MVRMMKSFTTLVALILSLTAFAQSTAKKTYLISASTTTPLVYNRISVIDVNGGKSSGEVYAPGKGSSIRNNEYQNYKRNDRDDDDYSNLSPLSGSVACAAYDARSNRLYYVPLQVSELRYLDLKESSPSFTCLSGQKLNLLHSREDVANQISRMTIGSDGYGYALTNDGEHLIRFTTQGTPVIRDLGVLVDNPKNTVFVRSSCSSWGGDIVGGKDGYLYLITLYNHVFRINPSNKNCDYLGAIKNLPAEFTSNGASADENGELIVSCGTSYGKKFSPLYKVKFPSLEASPVSTAGGLGNISDLASSNLLFQKAQEDSDKDKDKPYKKAENGVVAFTQSAEAVEDGLPTISLFPNPLTQGRTRFQLKATNFDKGEYRLHIVDAGGSAVMEARMNIAGKSTTQAFSFPAQRARGVYFLLLSDYFGRTVYSQQLIVE